MQGLEGSLVPSEGLPNDFDHLAVRQLVVYSVAFIEIDLQPRIMKSSSYVIATVLI
jgi:hypothetical protein